MTDVGIIGGGITGLTAAYHLRKAGLSARVCERSPRAGGVIQSHREGPWLAEGGPNTMLETSPLLREWIEELGLGSRRCYSDPGAGARYVVREGRPVTLPGSGPQFFASRLFSARAKMRLLREPFIPASAGELSVAEFVRRRLGQEFLDYAIDPLVTGIYAGDPAVLSIQHAFPRIHALEANYGSLIRGQILGARERKKRGEVSKANAKKFSFDDGLHVLPETVCQSLGEAVQLATEVEEVIRTDTGWRLRAMQRGQATELECRSVLFCGTAHTLAKLRIQAPVPSLARLGEVEYAPVTSVVLGFRREDVAHPGVGFGMLIPHCEGFRILGTIFSSSLFPGRAPDGHLTLTTYVGGVRRPEIAGMADDALLDLVLGDLGRLLGVRGRPVFQHFTRWAHAIPQYNVGYGQFKALLDEAEKNAPGFFIAGHFRDGVALSDSVLTGIRTAARIAAYVKSIGAGRTPCVQ
jgi:oxygen-dependent protoporphyrinogen oxidase